MNKNYFFLKVYLYIVIKFLIILTFHNVNSEPNDLPIEIYADEGIEWHKNDNKYLAIGNAKAIQGTLSLKSDYIEAFYEENTSSEMDIVKVEAHKNVIVTDEKVKITGGDSAEFEVKKDYFKIIVLSLFFSIYSQSYFIPKPG